MRGVLVSWAATAAALLLGAYLLGGVEVEGIGAALIAAVVVGLINAFVRPVLFMLTLPINLLTLGLFTFVINAILLALAAYVVPGFAVSGFLSALALALIVAVVNALAGAAFKRDRR
jgi:putative membrane protein